MRTYRETLKNNFEVRFEKNPRYSLRAYARDLGISVSRLSEIFNHKSGLSVKNAEKIASNLGLNRKEFSLFLNQVTAEHARNSLDRKSALQRLSNQQTNKVQFVELEEELFAFISDYHHYVLLDLIQTKSFRHDLKWIASRLNIEPFQVRQILDRLEKLKLIKNQNGRISISTQDLATSNDVPSEAIKKFQRQILKKAVEAIDFQNVLERDITTITLPLDVALIPELKHKIKVFRREIYNWIKESNINAEEVYCLNLNLIRLTNAKTKEKQ